MQIAAAGSLVNRMVALLLPAAAARAAPVQDALDPAAILVRALRAEAARGGPAGEALRDIADALQPPGGGEPDTAVLSVRIEAAARVVLAARPELQVLDRLIEVVESEATGGADAGEPDAALVDRIVRKALGGKAGEPLERSIRDALHDLAPEMTAGSARAALVRERAILDGLPQLDLLRAAQHVAGQPQPSPDITLTLPPIGPGPPPEARVRVEPEEGGAGGKASSTAAVRAVVRVDLPQLGATEVQLSLSGHNIRLDVQVAAGERIAALREDVPVLEAWLAGAGLAAATRVRALQAVVAGEVGRRGMSLWA